MENFKEKFDLICKPIPTYALSDEIGLDTETSYILNLTTKENYEIANAYLKATCFENYIPIPDSYVGEKLIIEYTTMVEITEIGIAFMEILISILMQREQLWKDI